MLKLKHYLIAALLFTSTQASSAEIGCATEFSSLVPEGNDLSLIDPRDLDDWLTALKDDDCAQITLDGYSDFAGVIDVYQPGTRLSPIELINKSAAVLNALNKVLSQEAFYGDKENRIRDLLPDRITLASVPDVIFDITSVDINGNAFFSVGKSRDAQIDQLLSYKQSCATPDSNACREWERFVRFFAAITFAVEDISESHSGILLENVKAGLTEYISDWDDYYENRKPQLPWELLANEVWNRDIRQSKYFPRPPKSDLVVFHPQLVYTRFDSIDSEIKLEGSILWEIVGINYWDRSILTGVSLVSSKLDSTDSMGLLLTLRNVYSLGVIEQDDDETWFVSVDLFDFMVDKKNEFAEKLNQNLESLEGG